MAPRRALLIDPDREFAALVAEALKAYDFETTVAEDGRAAISRLDEIDPELCLIGVELPDKGGFALCNAARRKARSLPIVLATRSVPWREMTLHQKVQTHASSYLDKRKTDRDGLLRAVGRLIELGPAVVPPDNEGLAEGALDGEQDEGIEQIVASVTADEPDWRVIPAMDEETEALLASIDEEDKPSPAALAPEAASTGREGMSDLEREVQGLRHELEEARRTARASPFSSDFLGLKEEVRRQADQITRLQEGIHARDARLVKAEIRVRKMAKRVLAAQEERSLAASEREESRARVERVETELALVQSDLDESRTQLSEAWETREAALAEKRQLQEASQRLRDEIDALRQVHEASLERARSEAQAASDENAQLRGQLAAAHSASAELTKKVAAREAEARKAQEETKALGQTHVRELERLRAEADATATALEAQQAQGHSLRDTVAELTAQAGEMEGLLDRERRKAEAAQQLHDSQIQSVTRQLSAKVESLTALLEKARGRVTELERGVEEQRIMGAGTEQDRRRLQAQLDQLRKELEQERRGREEDGRRATHQMAEANQRLDAAHVALSELQATLDQERREREEDSRRAQAQEAQAAKSLAVSQAELGELRAALEQEQRGRQEDAQRAAAQQAEAAQRLEVTRTRFNDLHVTLEEERRARKEERAQIEKNVKTKLAQVEESGRKEREALLQEARQQADGKMQELRKRQAEETAALRAAAARAEESLQSALQEAKTEASLARSQARREESVRRRLEDELREVESRYVAAEKQAEAEHLQAIVNLETELRARHEELVSVRAAHEGTLSEREARHREASEESARRLGVVEGERVKLAARIEELEGRLREVESAREQDRAHAESASKDVRAQHEAAERALRDELSRKEESLRESRDELTRLRDSNAAEIKEIRGQLGEASSAQAKTQKQLEEARTRIRTLEDKIDAASQERLAAMRDLTRKYEDEIAALGAADASKAAAVKHATEEATAAQNRADEVGRELAEARQEISRKQQSLLDLQRTVDSLRAMVGDFSGSRSESEPARLREGDDEPK